MTPYKSVMVTGHRPQHMTEGETVFAKDELLRLARKLKDEYGTELAISGMALGADTWWAEAALEVGLDYAAYIPFESQPDRWRSTDQAQWRYLRAKAASEKVIAPAYSVGALHARNDAMIKDSDLAIAVWKPSKTTGGTASAVTKIKKLGRDIVVVDLDDLKTYIKKGD